LSYAILYLRHHNLLDWTTLITLVMTIFL